jgi:predicted amino acid dehydrogenase
VITVPYYGRELLLDPELARHAIGQAAEFSQALGSCVTALTGIIPAITDLGRDIRAPDRLRLTTGHATTACAMALSISSALSVAGRDLRGESVAFVGVGAIGSTTLRLMLDSLRRPQRVILCDLPSKQMELESLADSVRAAADIEVDVQLASATGRLPDELYRRASLFIGATNMPDVVDVMKLHAGTILVDDSFPVCFDLDKAIARVESRNDILVSSGGSLRVPDTMIWHAALPAELAAFAPHTGASMVLPSEHEITGCMLSALLSARHGFPATLGPASIADCRAHWQGLARLGVQAPNLSCGSWVPQPQHLARLRSLAPAI